MPTLFKHETDDPKRNAQRNLIGRTHYVDDGTLRWHKSRILQTVVTDDGLLFALVESYAANTNNTRRLFRPVIFDVFGTVVERVKLDEGFSTRKTAEKAMWKALNEIDAKAITLAGIENARHWHTREMNELQEKVLLKKAG